VSGADPLDRLRRRIDLLGAPLCLGVDPDPDALPDGLSRDAGGVERYAIGLIDAVAPEVAAVKINVAFFEALGSPGWRALEVVRQHVPADLVVILDAKRGDIGPSAARYAAGLLGALDGDGVTVSPYLGEDGVEPFLAFPGKLVYLLARTSNPSAGRFQDLRAGERTIAERVAEWANERWTDGRVGLVVGATAPDALIRLRLCAPRLAFLVPGIGAQGGELRSAVAACHGTAAPGLIAISRGIAATAASGDWRAAARSAAASWRARLVEAAAPVA
jgi:orotidine 5'-phosphate decarboxylase subfamily 2